MAYNPIVVGGGTEATAQRVTIATDSTGVVSVDDNGGALTVDGTVTANLAAGTNNIGDVDILSIAAGDNNIGNVDIVTMPTVTVNAHAVTNAGTFAVQVDGSALTSLQLIDDPVQVLGTDTYTEASSKGVTIGAVRRDADTTLVNTTNEFGPLQMDANGRLKVEAFSGETLPVSLTSTTVTGTVAVTQSGTWDEVGINDSGNSITVDNAQLSVVGSGTEAAAMRVTIATDSTGVLSIDDNGGAITVDGTVTVTATDLDIRNLAPATDTVAIGDGTSTATVRNLAANDALNVSIVDGAGDQITSFGGGTQYTEDAAAAANPVGTAPILVRKDTPATVADTDGDNVAQRGTNYGAAYVQLVTSAGAYIDSVGGGTQYSDADANADPTGTVAMGTDGSNIYAVHTDTSGDLQVDILTIAAGDNNIGNVDVASSALPTGASTLAEQQSQTTHLATIAGDTTAIQTATELIDDAISTAGTTTYTEAATKVMNIGAVRRDANTSLVDTTNEVAPLQVNATGELKVAQIQALPAGDNNIGNVDIVSGTVTTVSTVTNLSQLGGTAISMNTGVRDAGTQRVTIATNDSVPVTGTFRQATQPVSGTFYQATQPVSNAIADGWDNAASDGASVSGDVAHDSPDAGEPVKIGAKGYAFDGTAPQTASAEADRVNLIADLQGIQYVQTAHPNFWHVNVDYASAQTNASVKAAPGASLSLYITTLVISNGATAGKITLLDGSGGTVLLTLYPAINGGGVVPLKEPIKLTANTALCITSTTVTTHAVFASGFIAA